MNVLVMPRGKDWIVKIEGRKMAYAVFDRRTHDLEANRRATALGMNLARERKVALVVMNDAGDVVEKKDWWLK